MAKVKEAFTMKYQGNSANAVDAWPPGQQRPAGVPGGNTSNKPKRASVPPYIVRR